MSSEKQTKNSDKCSKQRNRKNYPLEFRLNAVKMVTALGMTNEQVAQKLGVSTVTVRRWVLNRYRLNATPLQDELDVGAELKATQKRLAQLQMECDFLKKAAAYFARESK